MKRQGKLSKAFPAVGFVALLILGFAGQALGNTKPKFVYVVNTGSNTISGYNIDGNTGALNPIPGSPFAAGAAPVSVAVHPTGKFALVANRCDGTAACANGSVSVYTINSSSGILSPAKGSPFTSGSLTTSVAIDPTGKFAFVSSQCVNSCSSGAVSAYAINSATGTLTPAPGSPFAVGLFPTPVAVDPTGKFAYVANEGSSNVSAYTIASTTGALNPVSGSPFATGSNPTSVAVDPTGKFAYVVNFGSNTISGYGIDSTTGALTPLPDSPFVANPAPVLVAMDPMGKFALVANRCDSTTTCLNGSVSVYTINSATGNLSSVPGSPFASGFFPMSVAMDPMGELAYVSNLCLTQTSCDNTLSHGTISAYTFNSTSGNLSQVPGSPFTAGFLPFSLAIAGDPAVPFAAFRLRTKIDVDRKTSFKVDGGFTLGSGSDGINPLTEDVTLQVGTFSTTIPAGSFREKRSHEFEIERKGDKEEKKKEGEEERRRSFAFEGYVNGVDLEVTIYQVGGRRFIFACRGRGHILSEIVNPVTVGLTIGDDEGSTTVSADIDN
jgi:6-phosphogluconolactonase